MRDAIAVEEVIGLLDRLEIHLVDRGTEADIVVVIVIEEELWLPCIATMRTGIEAIDLKEVDDVLVGTRPKVDGGPEMGLTGHAGSVVDVTIAAKHALDVAEGGDVVYKDAVLDGGVAGGQEHLLLIGCRDRIFQEDQLIAARTLDPEGRGVVVGDAFSPIAKAREADGLDQ